MWASLHHRPSLKGKGWQAAFSPGLFTALPQPSCHPGHSVGGKRTQELSPTPSHKELWVCFSHRYMNELTQVTAHTGVTSPAVERPLQQVTYLDEDKVGFQLRAKGSRSTWGPLQRWQAQTAVPEKTLRHVLSEEPAPSEKPWGQALKERLGHR